MSPIAADAVVRVVRPDRQDVLLRIGGPLGVRRRPRTRSAGLNVADCVNVPAEAIGAALAAAVQVQVLLPVIGGSDGAPPFWRASSHSTMPRRVLSVASFWNRLVAALAELAS